MKSNFKSLRLADLCSWFGVSRQAYYQNKHRVYKDALEYDIILVEIRHIRKLHPKLGGRKLYLKMNKFLESHQIKMGRDAFFSLLGSHNLLIRARRRYHVTTNSNHWMRKYPYLIKEIEALRPNHIWVSDITYWKVGKQNFYISFITDAYSRKIVGYQVACTMEAVESVAALKMAIASIDGEIVDLYHHSDRGSQYCSSKYVALLKKKGVKISMTENGDPLENAIAERLNGIIKGEYLFDSEIKTLQDAKKVLKGVVNLYNEDRPHSSISNLFPSQVHEDNQDIEIKRLWKNYYQSSTPEKVSI
jgi:transposase InsO family protein